jgi:hypothetical protein
LKYPHLGIVENVVYWAKSPLKGFFLQNCNICINHICLVECKLYKRFYNPYVGITFEEEKPNVWFVNVMWVLHFEYLESNLICDLNVWILQMLCLFQWQINIKNMNIAAFVLMVCCVYVSIMESFFCILIKDLIN